MECIVRCCYVADVRDALAAVDAARGATPELLAKLMQRVQRL
jgi:hypothetical protein